MRSIQRVTWPATRTTLGIVGATVAASWVYLVVMAWGMDHMDIKMLLMPEMTHWGAVDLFLVWVMWAVMMAAMMLPSATPMLLTFGAMAQRVSPPRTPRHTLVFASGYLTVWALFSVAATISQWALLEWDWVSPMMTASAPWLSAALLVCAGVYQFTRWKGACLEFCRSPLAFLIKEWRIGADGAFVMGLRHGAYCLGCCWALMALLLVLGVMNVAWIFALTVLVLAEKTLPGALWLTRATGIGFIVSGIWIGLHAS